MTVPSQDAPATTSAEAFVVLRPQFEGVPEDQVLLINADMNAVGTRLLAHADRIASLVPQAHATFKDFDDTAFRQVALCAMALLQAHSLHRTSAPTVDRRPALAGIGTPLRVRLIDAMQYMVREKKIDAERVASIRGLHGYRFLAADLMGLSNVLGQSWDAIAGLCAVTREDIAQAASLSDALFVAISDHEGNEREVAAATLLRQKAYTFVYHRYEGIRRVVSFLRWEQNDADDFAPSLFAGRGGRPRKVSSEGDVARQDDSKSEPAAGQPVAGQPVAGQPAAGQGTSPLTHENVIPGQPGGSPFLR